MVHRPSTVFIIPYDKYLHPKFQKTSVTCMPWGGGPIALVSSFCTALAGSWASFDLCLSITPCVLFFFTLLMVSAKIVAKLQARQDEAVQLAELHSRTAATLSRKVDNGSNNNKDRRLNWRPIPASPTMEPTTEHVSVIIV